MRRPLEALPNRPLTAGGDLTRQFRSRGVEDFHAAARYVRDLPYGRISDRADLTLVFTERRGTCTTKHALLAQLAHEQGLDVALTLGVYEMSGRNTADVAPVLAKYGLDSIPEAHCSLTYAGARIDVTRAARANEDNDTFLYEETITPAQIGSYKIALHQQFMRDWIAGGRGPKDRTAEDVWRIREECIAAISGG